MKKGRPLYLLEVLKANATNADDMAIRHVTAEAEIQTTTTTTTTTVEREKSTEVVSTVERKVI